ncbi:MAG: hypothetical protein AB7V55_06625 [Oscillospiraceae bacterium]
MKKMRGVICGLLVILVFMLVPVTIFAATGSQDGLEVEITTDKSSYAAGEAVAVSYSIKNTNVFAVDNITMELVLPAGVTLQTGSATVTIPTLAAGATETQRCYIGSGWVVGECGDAFHGHQRQKGR